jgi:hypothetical protein
MFCHNQFVVKKNNQKYCSRSCVLLHIQQKNRGKILVEYNELEFINDYNSDMRYVDILEKHFLHPRTYRRIFNKLIAEKKIIKRPQKPLHELAKHYKKDLDVSLIINLYQSHSITYIAERLRVNRKTIEDRLKNSGKIKLKKYKISASILRDAYIMFKGDNHSVADYLKISYYSLDGRLRYYYKKGLLPEYKTFVYEKIMRLQQRKMG